MQKNWSSDQQDEEVNKSRLPFLSSFLLFNLLFILCQEIQLINREKYCLQNNRNRELEQWAAGQRSKEETCDCHLSFLSWHPCLSQHVFSFTICPQSIYPQGLADVLQKIELNILQEILLPNKEKKYSSTTMNEIQLNATCHLSVLSSHPRLTTSCFSTICFFSENATMFFFLFWNV